MAAALARPVSAGAAPVQWACVDDNWASAGCWSPPGVPAASDGVFVPPVLGVDTVVRIDASTGTAQAQDITVEATTGPAVTVIQSGGALSAAGYEYIGRNGNGGFTHSGGSNHVGDRLFLGYQTGATGTYDLFGTGQLSAGLEIVGYVGSGAFSHSGAGTNNITGQLQLGSYAGSSGTYDLSGTGALSASGEDIGIAGAGHFMHSAGTNELIGFLSLGVSRGGAGDYHLTGTGIVSAGNEIIGNQGNGSFTQSGGSNTVASSLMVAANSGSGNYDLSGTGSLAARIETIGRTGHGTFTQSGGTNTVTDYLRLGDSLFGSGVYDLSGTAVLNAGREEVGYVGAGAIIQSGGTNVTDHLTLSSGTSVSSGSYDLSGAGSLSARGEIIGAYGIGEFNQTGGTHTVEISMLLGTSRGSHGSYRLGGTGKLSATQEIIGFEGTGTFVQDGGTHTAQVITLASKPFSTGSFRLEDGSLTAGTITQWTSGAGTFDFIGGRLSVDRFDGTLINRGGVLAPGASPGTTFVNGSYAVSDPAAVLEIEIASPVVGSGYDTVEVTGPAMLGGILDVSLLDGFLPSLSDTFDILTANTVSGTFNSLRLPEFSGLTFDISYLHDASAPDIVRLSVIEGAVPEPASSVLLLAGLLGVWSGRKRRPSAEPTRNT